MSLIPSLTTLRVEDFPSQQEWIGKLLLPINQFLLAATTSINGGITFGDNIPCQTQTLNFTYGGASDFPKTFLWKITSAPIELRVCSATENGVPVAMVPAWSYTNSQVTIAGLILLKSTGVTALKAGAVYNVILRGNP